jgi:hypothetical protein
MPYATPTNPTERRRRVLIVGATGSGKTHAFRTFPAPAYVQIYPGEKGQDTLLKADGSPAEPSMIVRTWENADPGKSGTVQTSTQVIEEVRKETIAALRGDYGPVSTFCGDGLHKLYGYVMDALSGGEFFAGSPFKTESRNDTAVVDPRIASQAERWLFDYLSLVCQSRRIQYAVFTTWDADKGTRRAKKMADGSKEKWTEIPTAKLPALYSNAAGNILGEFGIVLHASSKWERQEVLGADGKGTGKFTRVRTFRWQTAADDEVASAAIKVPSEVEIPKFVRADWRELAKYLEG